MTYAGRETSIDSGQPVELIRCAYENLEWLYTTADVKIVVGAEEYTPEPAMRSAFEDSDEPEKDSFTITLPRDNPVADLFRVSPPGGIVSITVLRDHYGENDWQVYRSGRVINSVLKGNSAELTCESVFTSLQRTGLRQKYQRACPHVLYGTRCGVNKAAHLETFTVDSVSGTSIICSAAIGFADNWFAGGVMVYTNSLNGATERRSIRSSVNATGELVLSTFPFGLSSGVSASVYPGCRHTLSDCSSKFSNIDNYGGMPYIPTEANPFDGTKVF